MIKIQKINPNAKILKGYVKDELINFELPMQRGYVWTREKKSKLILSILQGYPIPPLYANYKEGVFHIIDGQQRGKTIVGFQLNQFSLGELPPVIIDGKEYEITGKKFSDLPKSVQLAIEKSNLDLHYGENMTDEEQKEMFIRLNSGKPLSPTEMTKARIKSVVEVTNLAKHNVFKRIINKRGMAASKNASLIMQMYVAIFEPYKCMLSSAITKSLSDIQISEEEQQRIRTCLDVFEAVYSEICEEKSDISKKLALIFKRKSHFIAFIYVIDKAIQMGDSDVGTLVRWAKHFFNSDLDKTTISDEYNARLKDAMNSDESVKARFDAMFGDFQQFIGEQPSSMNEQEATHE